MGAVLCVTLRRGQGRRGPRQGHSCQCAGSRLARTDTDAGYCMHVETLEPTRARGKGGDVLPRACPLGCVSERAWEKGHACLPRPHPHSPFGKGRRLSRGEESHPSPSFFRRTRPSCAPVDASRQSSMLPRPRTTRSSQRTQRAQRWRGDVSEASGTRNGLTTRFIVRKRAPRAWPPPRTVLSYKTRVRAALRSDHATPRLSPRFVPVGVGDARRARDDCRDVVQQLEKGETNPKVPSSDRVRRNNNKNSLTFEQRWASIVSYGYLYK